MGFTVSYISEAINRYGVTEASVLLKAEVEDVEEFKRLFMTKIGRPETRLEVTDEVFERDYNSMGVQNMAKKYKTSTRVIIREVDLRGIQRKRTGYNGHR